MKALILGVALAALATAAPAATVDAVEFYHAGLDHYFMTASNDEAAILDEGVRIIGWKRTGYSFKVELVQEAGTSPVCRFYSTAFAPKGSHFYTADPQECTFLKAGGFWTYEGIAFFAHIPDYLGNCAFGEQPVYRFYNSGQGNAPNHRFTTDPAVRASMPTKGWVPEGKAGIALCASGSGLPEGDFAFTRSKNLLGAWTFTYFYNGAHNDHFNFTNILTNTAPVEISSMPYIVAGSYDLGLVNGGFRVDIGKFRMITFGTGKNDYFVFDFVDVDTISGCFYPGGNGAGDPTTGPCVSALTGVRTAP